MAPAIWHTQQQNNVYHRHSRFTVGTLDKLKLIIISQTSYKRKSNKKQSVILAQVVIVIYL